MNTITDLRNTLGQHADDVHGVPHVDRLDQIQSRVRVVRRRRRATVAGVAAAAIAIAGGATLLPGHHETQPANRDLAGHTAPETMTSLGYTYSFDRGVEGDGKARITFPKSDSPRLITWAAKSSSVSLGFPYDADGDGSGPDRVTSSDTAFDDFELLNPGEYGAVSVSGDGPVALAVYDLSTPAPGVTKAGVTFRQHAGDGNLIDGWVSDVGETEHSFTFPMPANGLRISAMCFGVPPGLFVTYELNHDGGIGGHGCLDDKAAPFDPGVGGVSGDSYSPRPGGAHVGELMTLRVWVTRKSPKETRPGEVPVPTGHIGLAVYERTAPADRVGDIDVEGTVDSGGHVWRFVRVAKSSPGEPSLSTSVSATGHQLLIMEVASQTRTGNVRSRMDGEELLSSEDTYGPGGHFGEIALIRDGRHTFELSGSSVGPKTVLGLAIYERVD